MVKLRGAPRRSTSTSGTINRRPGSRTPITRPSRNSTPFSYCWTIRTDNHNTSSANTATTTTTVSQPLMSVPFYRHRMRAAPAPRGPSYLVGRYVGRAEHVRVAQVEGAQVGHQVAQLPPGRLVILGRTLLFDAPGVLLGGVVHRLGEVPRPVGVLGHRHAQDGRRVRGGNLLLVASEADHALHVLCVALDNLHEPGLISSPHTLAFVV